MPSVRGMGRIAASAIVAVTAACSMASPAQQAELLRTPFEVRSGQADSAVAPVERNVSREEVAAAVRPILERSPICISWPAVWLNEGSSRSAYVLRADLMARDWGEDVAREGERRMDEFVDMGFMTKRERPDVGARAHEYALTPLGRQRLQGSPLGGGRPVFCAPSQRRLIEVTRIEFGRFPCGTLRAYFTYAAQDWPEWARTDAARARIADDIGTIGAVENGAVSLGRQWFSQRALPQGVTNGSLQSTCYNAQYQRVADDDLDLHAQAMTSASGS